MDSARQVIRWTIPGTILVLTVGLAQLIMLTAIAVSSGQGIETDVGASEAILAFFAGVPLGFLLFQLYYLLWDSVTPNIPFLPPPVDRGAWLLNAIGFDYRRKLTVEVERALGPLLAGQNRDIEACLRRPVPMRVRPRAFLRFLGPGGRRRRRFYIERRKEYAARRRVHWIIAKYLMNFVIPEPLGQVVRSEYTSFNDIYHALGASMTAIAVGAIAFFVYEPLAKWHLTFGEHPVASALAMVVIVCGAGGSFVVLRATRRQTHQTLLNGVAVGIRAGLIARGTPGIEAAQLSLDLSPSRDVVPTREPTSLDA